jgi:hypothetical protein
MSQRDSGYARKRDFYEIPAWVTAALIPHLRPIRRVWEPAAGSGKMVCALGAAGLEVEGLDIAFGVDFLLERKVGNGADAIITNPPMPRRRNLSSMPCSSPNPPAAFWQCFSRLTTIMPRRAGTYSVAVPSSPKSWC